MTTVAWAKREAARPRNRVRYGWMRLWSRVWHSYFQELDSSQTVGRRDRRLHLSCCRRGHGALHLDVEVRLCGTDERQSAGLNLDRREAFRLWRFVSRVLLWRGAA